MKWECEEHLNYVATLHLRRFGEPSDPVVNDRVLETEERFEPIEPVGVELVEIPLGETTQQQSRLARAAMPGPE